MNNEGNDRFTRIGTQAGPTPVTVSLFVSARFPLIGFSEPARFQSLTSFDNDRFRGQKRFIFADLTGAGFYTLIFSSEDYLDIDPRLLEQVITKALD
ncbi:MAG: hypothetical protein WEB37_02790 [Bacteroidota bacterium]